MEEWEKALIIILVIGFSILLMIALPNLEINKTNGNSNSISSLIIEPNESQPVVETNKETQTNTTENVKALGLLFYDNKSNCKLTGDVLLNENLIGKTVDGYFDLTANIFDSYDNIS